MKRNHLLLGAALALFTLAATITLLPAFLSYRASQPQRIGKSIIHLSPTIDETQLQQILKRAKLLREHWRPWAEKHREALRAMLRASPEDTVRCERVYSRLPKPPKDWALGFPGKLLTIETMNVPFAVCVNGEAFQQLSESEGGNQHRKNAGHTVADTHKEELTANFRSKRDILILSSANGGSVRYDLWVSGRITRTTPDPVHHRDHYEDVAPPFDFLN